MIKIYIHHFYSRSLFLKFFHNTINRVPDIANNIGTILCEYNNKKFELVFNPELHDNEDGYHLMDFLTINYQMFQWNEYSEIDCINKKTGMTAHRGGGQFGVNDIPIMKWLADKTQNRKGWLISIMRTEKSFIDSEGIRHSPVMDLEYHINRLKNHYIFSDNFFIDRITESVRYSNHKFIFTNTIFQWNELLSIRWYYEFANIFEKINAPYKLCFSMRNHKKNRAVIIEQLSALNNDDIYLSRTDNCQNIDYKVNNLIVKDLKNVHLNKWGTDNWDDISYIQNIEHYLEYMMRILPMARMHILSESWDFAKGQYISNYLSEKTYGFVLAKIPFISTHTYPYDILREITGVENHPFYNEAVEYRGMDNKFVEFVNNFLKDYEKNYKLCKDWVDTVHNIILNKIENENSFLNILIAGLDSNQPTIKKTII